MTVFRLTAIRDVLRIWGFLREAITYESKYLRYAHDLDVYRKIICTLVRQGDKAWVAVALGDDGEPVGFVMSHDCSAIHAEIREFEVSMYYFKPGFKESIQLLQRDLDRFCKRNGISFYYLTTSSRCGSASRVFNTSWRGLEHSNTVFKRIVS